MASLAEVVLTAASLLQAAARDVAEWARRVADDVVVCSNHGLAHLRDVDMSSVTSKHALLFALGGVSIAALFVWYVQSRREQAKRKRRDEALRGDIAAVKNQKLANGTAVAAGKNARNVVVAAAEADADAGVDEEDDAADAQAKPAEADVDDGVNLVEPREDEDDDVERGDRRSSAVDDSDSDLNEEEEPLLEQRKDSGDSANEESKGDDEPVAEVQRVSETKAAPSKELAQPVTQGDSVVCDDSVVDNKTRDVKEGKQSQAKSEQIDDEPVKELACGDMGTPVADKSSKVSVERTPEPTSKTCKLDEPLTLDVDLLHGDPMSPSQFSWSEEMEKTYEPGATTTTTMESMDSDAAYHSPAAKIGHTPGARKSRNRKQRNSASKNEHPKQSTVDRNNTDKNHNNNVGGGGGANSTTPNVAGSGKGQKRQQQQQREKAEKQTKKEQQQQQYQHPAPSQNQQQQQRQMQMEELPAVAMDVDGYEQSESPGLASQHSEVSSQDSGRATGGLASSLSPMDEHMANGSAVNGSLLMHDDLTNPLPMYEFEIPNSLVGLIIGIKGKTIRELSLRTNVRMLIRQHHTSEKVNTHQICQVRGKRDEINHCLQMLRRRFPPARFPELNLQPVLPPPMPNQYFDMIHTQPSWLTLPDDVPCEVAVSSVVDASHFFLQQPTHPSFASLRHLDMYMLRLYSDHAQIPELPVPCQIGLLCAAPVINAWFRAVTVTYFEDTDEVMIRFVDYGGYARMARQELRQIRTDLMSLPFQATEVLLAHVKPVDGTTQWDEAAMEDFRQMCMGKVVTAKCVGYSADTRIPMVELYAPSDEGDEHKGTRFDTYLMERGLARTSDPSKMVRGSTSVAMTSTTSAAGVVAKRPSFASQTSVVA